MKVLITGEASYAGTQFAKRIEELNKEWDIDFISVRNNTWKDVSFSEYNAIYHVAGIVHKKEHSKNKELYYKVNRDLTYELALKAKFEGVKSFIFLSTMAVYGLIGSINKETIITRETVAKPTSHYGKSKLEAENLLDTLQSKEFNVSILRIPMLYGYGCPGNYSALSKLVKFVSVFPKLNNTRSMLFIDHLSDVIIYLIDKQSSGLMLIKNPDDINILYMVSEIAKNKNKKLHHSYTLGLLLKLIGNNFKKTRKMFGNLTYHSQDCEIVGFNFENLSFEDTIAISEGRKFNR